MVDQNQFDSSSERVQSSVSVQAVALLFANVVGAIGYVMSASGGGWVIPAERAAGINTITGEPFIWALSIFPIVSAFFVINVVWVVTLARRHWSGGRYFSLAVFVWVVAIAIDFSHH